MSHYVVVNKKEKAKRKKHLLHRLVAFLLLLVLAALAVCYFVYRKSMTPTILDLAKTRVKADATRAINDAVLCSLQGVNLADLAHVEKNDQNEVVLISANAAQANMLARQTSLLTQNKIDLLCEQTLSIPLGSLSGIPLFNQLGPKVEICLAPMGSVICTFVSKFESVGINQTLHRIYLNVQSKVDLIVPTMHEVLEMDTPILICETVIVGKVPDTYFQGDFCIGKS